MAGACQLFYTPIMIVRGKRQIDGSHALGKQLRQLRKAKGWTIAELADKIDASPAHLSEIETGKVTNPGIELLARIARALNVGLTIVSGQGQTDPNAALEYESPFSATELAQQGGFIAASADALVRVLLDTSLSLHQRRQIANQVVSFAQWLRHQKLNTENDS